MIVDRVVASPASAGELFHRLWLADLGDDQTHARALQHGGRAVLDPIIGDHRGDALQAAQDQARAALEIRESTSTTSSSAWLISFCSAWISSGSASISPSGPSPWAPMNMRCA